MLSEKERKNNLLLLLQEYEKKLTEQRLQKYFLISSLDYFYLATTQRSKGQASNVFFFDQPESIIRYQASSNQ
jgi:hypothetical protein